MSISVPPHVEPFKYIKPTGLYATTLTAATSVIVNDAGEDELVFDNDATGAGSVVIELDFVIPDDFKKFANKSDDLSIRATQNAGASNDSTLTINVIDTAGTDCDDDSINAQDLTNVFATYDCAIDAGAFVAGDHITVQITTTNPANDDDCMFTLPKLKYIPQ